MVAALFGGTKLGTVIGETGPTVIDFEDERQRSLLIGSLMVGGGLACLVAIFVGYAAYGRLLGKLAGVLLVYGGMRIWRAVKGEQAPRIIGVSSGPKAETVPIARVLLAQTSLPPSAWNSACLMLGRAGGVVLALCFLSLAVSVVLFQVQRTVVLIGVPDLASGYVLLAAVVFSLLVAISWASLSGVKGLAMVGRTLGFWLIALSLAVVPIVITSGQLAQAAMFSGRTSLVFRTYRI